VHLMADRTRARVDGPTNEDLSRVQDVLRRIGGPHVSWGAASVLEVWIAETRMEAEREAARRMLLATWVLALATTGLVAATVGLIVVTVGE
jgi:hypothetical protein